jgi:hypothetical protein
MSVTRSRPGDPNVRKGKEVGPDYPEDRFRNPVGAGLDSTFGNHKDKAICSPNDTTFGGADLPMNDKYDSLWPKGGK